jgi:hypothetical protein
VKGIAQNLLTAIAIALFVSACMDGPPNPEQRIGSVLFALQVVGLSVALPAWCGYVIGRDRSKP